MREGMHESPFNSLPAVVWLLALPVIASEALFALGSIGLIGGAEGVGLRLSAIQAAAFAPQQIAYLWSTGQFEPAIAYRLLTYPFIHGSPIQAVFVVVFTLALGNMVATRLRPWSIVALYLGSAVGGALVHTIVAGAIGAGPQLLIGGYPAVYGLVGGFTFLLWTRLAAENANRFRAFTLIGALLAFQLIFAVVARDASLSWVAEIAGFATGFLLSFVLVDGGFARVLQQFRQR
ncbi:rhomboid family intramembrane serine protease [Paracoccus sp. TK19116]|uniref:Rhomboid family intramembrane serine protease n=1 Tax=Paracoccus albicereus TaxID=2922394 RepID=A0ABT1MSB8_9RHOB|nr:rhomboid family intramembrane serine protease [Paracoccus albicereus]MCQ0971210.1 rhomboid family intramembrane serine protease [Paracoccus albicereus]